MILLVSCVLLGLTPYILWLIVVYEEWGTAKLLEKIIIIERAEQQHREWMSGDDAGFYGDFPPADLYN